MRFRLGVRGAIVALAALSLALVAESQADLFSRFEHETNAVQKAKLMPALGDAEFAEIRKQVEAPDFGGALMLLRRYQGQAQSCLTALDSTKVDAEKHPNGFKQLQISLQESLRRVDALLPPMTSEEQAPFLEVRKELDEMNRHLIEQLFPRRTPPPAKPKEEKEQEH